MQWDGKTGGTTRMQRMLIVLLKHIDTRVVYGVMSVWLLWYMVVRPRSTRAIFRFHHRHRGRSVLVACIDTYRSYYCFGEAIMDRFAAFAGKEFRVEVPDMGMYASLFHGKQGFIMLFSHEGNTEMAGYGLGSPRKRMNVLAYMGDTETVMQNREQALAINNLRILPMRVHDMSHVYAINEAIGNGEIVSMAADRIVDGKSIACSFMGSMARFPAGPFRMCAATGLPVLLVFVIKTRRDTYRVEIKELEYKSETHTKREQVAALAQAYAKELEQMARKHPYQWFNFYDFWEEQE